MRNAPSPERGWRRVTRQCRCPICGKPDWCLVSEDGSASICARIQSDRRAGGAGWLHITGEPHPTFIAPASPPMVKQLPLAPIGVLDRVYRSLLALLSLSEEHRIELAGRGLTPDQVNSLGYVSLPVYGRSSVAKALTGCGLRLGGVPGFYLESGEVRLAGPAGMIIPVRDPDGRISALAVRCDNPEGGKYKWLSSARKPYGCSPGVPVHVARPPGCEEKEIWITEGPLKADIVAPVLNRTVLAVSGVGNWRGVLPVLKELRPQRVVVCFDMDKTGNPAVRLNLDALVACLLRRGVRTFEASWDSHFKGIDDLVAEGV